MAYTKTTWEDRVVDKPRTYTTQNNADGTITLIPQTGTVHKAGTPVNAANMNKIETGVAEAHNVLDSAFVSRGVLPVNANWNNYLTNGAYKAESVAAHSNHPNIGDWLLLDVSTGENFTTQVATNCIDGRSRRRILNGGWDWTPWVTAATKNDIYLQYPGIVNGVVYGESADFYGQSGFVLNFTSNVSTKIINININGTVYPVVVGDEQYSLDVVQNGTYSFVYANNHFFLRSGGGGGKLNVFTGLGQPPTNEGIWLKSNIAKNKVVTDSSVYGGGNWFVGSPVPTLPNKTAASYSFVAGNSFCAVGDNLYRLYGDYTGAVGNTAYLYRYNKANNTWTELAPLYGHIMPDGVNILPTLIQYNEYLYFFGGARDNFVNRYNMNTNTWSAVTTNRVNQYWSDIMYNGLVYFIYPGNSTLTFNFSTHTFTNIVSASGSIAKPPTYIMGGELHVIVNTSIYKLNTANGLWVLQTQQTSKALKGYYGCVLKGDKLYTLDDVANGGTLSLQITTLSGSSYQVVSVSFPKSIQHYGMTFFDNSLWMLEKTNPDSYIRAYDAVVRYMLQSKAYGEGTVVILRIKESSGAYSAELITSKSLSGINSRLLSYFDDVGYYSGGNVSMNIPVFVGTGTGWTQIK